MPQSEKKIKQPIVPPTPEELPRLGNSFTRSIGVTALRILGWRVKGELPRVPKAIFAAAPHTSNWDFIVAMIAILALGLKLSFLMKKEAFFWPCKNLFMVLGGIPIDRQAANDTVGQVSKWIAERDTCWIVITPEGTRSKVTRWKTGFLRIAEQADVPIVLVAWDYPSKTMYIDSIWPISNTHEVEADNIRDYINANYAGRHPSKQ